MHWFHWLHQSSVCWELVPYFNCAARINDAWMKEPFISHTGACAVLSSKGPDHRVNGPPGPVALRRSLHRGTRDPSPPPPPDLGSDTRPNRQTKRPLLRVDVAPGADERGEEKRHERENLLIRHLLIDANLSPDAPPAALLLLVLMLLSLILRAQRSQPVRHVPGEQSAWPTSVPRAVCHLGSHE